MTGNPPPTGPRSPIAMARSYFPPEDIAEFQTAAAEILTGRVSMGAWVERFQQTAAETHAAKFAFATNSCTAALEVSLLACGVEPGDGVIVPVQTFIATGMAVSNIGARPIFADIRQETLCLDPASLEAIVEPKVKAVILVHFGGLISPDVPRIQEICRQRGWALIEDAAHAPGARYRDQPSGAFGSTACFSYYPTKVLTSGEGGMIVTNDERIAKICRSYQFRGQDLDAPGEQFARPYGRNIRLPELSALLGTLQYRRLAEFVARRRAVAAVYDEMLASEPSIGRIPVPAECFHNYWLYTILLPARTAREELQRRMKERYQIDVAWSYFPPLHLMPVFRRSLQTQPGDCPVAEDLLGRTLCLPVHPLLTTDDAHCVADCLLYVYRDLAR